jgi:hypothetical protein
MESDPYYRHKLRFDIVRRSRAALDHQIRQSRLTIEQSKELLRALDKIIGESKMFPQEAAAVEGSHQAAYNARGSGALAK